MKRLVPILLSLLAASLSAQEATITFLDGSVDVRTESGATYPADFGDRLEAGDRVITGRGAEAELELASGGVVTVRPDTVFLIGSTTRPDGEQTSRLSSAVGSFAFKFNAVLGNEPQIGSTTAVAGVRGTEVVVYAGSDGTTRFEVLEGLVEIGEGEESVTLGAEQGVEVSPGRRPSNVFAFLEQPIDYGVWNAGLVDGFLDDPLPALRGVATEMREIIAEIERRSPAVEEL
ncbi:MAG: FecR family protein, partial [Spirochaetota bacterium]